jgi:hypothetical protein
LQYIAARMAFDKVDAQEIRTAVDRLIEDGVYSDDFLAIIDSNPPTLTDVLAPFRTYLHRTGILFPDKEAAVWQIIRHHVARIVDGTTSPFEGLELLIADVYWDYDFHKPTTKFLGDSHGIEHLFGLYWGHDDMVERPSEVSCNGKYGEQGFQELEKEILKSSKDWMKNCANKGVVLTGDPLRGSPAAHP